MRTRAILLLAAVSAGCYAGCNRQPAKRDAGKVEDLGPAQPELGMAERTKKIETELSLLRWRVGLLESENATVSTEEETYGVARTRFGPFAIVSRGVTPYLDGFKVKLSIGNLTSATFHGAKLKVTWGGVQPPPGYVPEQPTTPTADSFLGQRHREFDLTTVLSPGSYSLTEVTLTPAKPDEVKSITVGLELNVISLRGR